MEIIINSFGLAHKMRVLQDDHIQSKLESREKRRYQTQLRILAHDIANPLTLALYSVNRMEKPNSIDRMKSAITKIEAILNKARSVEKKFSSAPGQTMAIDAYNKLKDDFEVILEEKKLHIKFIGKKIF